MHPCGECGRTFTTRSGLGCHRGRAHQWRPPQSPPVLCECGLQFPTKTGLASHRRKVGHEAPEVLDEERLAVAMRAWQRRVRTYSVARVLVDRNTPSTLRGRILRATEPPCVTENPGILAGG